MRRDARGHARHGGLVKQLDIERSSSYVLVLSLQHLHNLVAHGAIESIAVPWTAHFSQRWLWEGYDACLSLWLENLYLSRFSDQPSKAATFPSTPSSSSPSLFPPIIPSSTITTAPSHSAPQLLKAQHPDQPPASLSQTASESRRDLTSPRGIFQQRDIHCCGWEMHIPHHAPSYEDVFDA